MAILENSSDWPICSGFLCFSVLEAIKKPCSPCLSISPTSPTGYWGGICLLSGLLLCTEDLLKLCWPGLEIQGHCQVTQVCQGRLPGRAPSPSPLGDSPTTSLQCWLAGSLLFPTPSFGLHHYLLMHLKRTRGLGHNRWLELMPEG